LNRLLYISYVFPPMTAGGVYRSLNFARFLPEYGWLPTILTVQLDRAGRVDTQILNKLPEPVQVVRTKSLERIIGYVRGTKFDGTTVRKGAVSLLKRFVDCWFFPDRHILWLLRAFIAACSLNKQHQYQAILSTYRPATNLLLGYFLKRIFRVKLLLDFRDLWVDEPSSKSDPLRKYLSGILERRIIRAADHIVTAVETISHRLKEKYDLDSHRVTTITNGFDPDIRPIFSASSMEPHEKMTITYTGSLYGSRSPERFFQALQRVFSRRPNMRKALRVVFVGNLSEMMVRRYNLSDVVEVYGYVPHHEVIEFLKRSDILLLLISKVNRDIALTGKIFEYIVTGKPVLALVPEDGVAAKLLIRAGIGRIVDPDDVQAIQTTIAQLYDEWTSNCLKIHPDWKVIEEFSRKNLTAKLARVLDNVVSLDRQVQESRSLDKRD